MGVTRDCPILSVSPIISGTGRATNFKFYMHIDRIPRNKSPLKILEKRERAHIQGLPNFWSIPISSGTGKATNFRFCTHIHRIARNKSPLKISGKVAVGVLCNSQKFSGRIAWLSLRQLGFLVLKCNQCN